MYIAPIIATMVLILKDRFWECCVGCNPPHPPPPPSAIPQIERLKRHTEITECWKVRRVAGEVGLLVLERTSKSIAPSW